MFGRLAEIAAEYLRKGSKVYIEGKLRTRKWQDKTDGKDRYTTEIIADEMQMLDGKGGGMGAGAPASSGGERAGARPRPRSPMRTAVRRAASSTTISRSKAKTRRPLLHCFVSSRASSRSTGARLGA